MKWSAAKYILSTFLALLIGKERERDRFAFKIFRIDILLLRNTISIMYYAVC